MDTVMSFRIYGKAGGDAADTCTAIIQQLERELSATDPASDLAQLNAAGEGALPEDAAQLLADTLALSHRTGGALDPTVYPLVCLWGFPAQAYPRPDGRGDRGGHGAGRPAACPAIGHAGAAG